ncbi:Peptidyl-prolyl cis-trans isomerase, cyclophilin-type [Metarhizium album ARSEF 1941]|uniref:peptidylprolyl isomerase n=1 Tax=Metarhizium album (strain ARSEF 1941) TaxID=1081103 RepID=A0A0B2WXK3_METAS|nr:Peptidyl-prolyl cis-trans isomerase, cyclophilin-type [Metarhizium album ARSEF 1941]KHN98294.1 Peptidyl-prolyl cis-trans isomerase, cyclophilin-type [Metarhizium album ARSEF 1941]
MSTIYNLEPQPTASAIIHTTLGEILVELFAKQTPLTCRNFLQHSLDGYYDGTIFHRLVPGFILQAGDPTGTGNGGESIYDGGAFGGDLDPWPMDERRGKNAGPTGVNFKDEFHSRLKFNRRGLLGMANESRADTNGSQFFFTLDKAEELNGKNTLFGRVAGDTIYNLAKIGESEVDAATERPLYPVRIERVEILVNPFEDMKKRWRVATQAVQKPAEADRPKKKKRKAGNQLLSFGDEEGGEEEQGLAFKRARFDTRLIAREEEPDERPKDERAAKRKSPKEDKKKQHTVRAEHYDEERRASNQESVKLRSEAEAGGRDEAEELSDEPEPPTKTALQKANEELAALKASMRRTIHSEKPAEDTKKKSALESMIPESSMRARKRRPGGNNSSANDDEAAMRLLRAFQSRLDKAPPEKQIQGSAEKGDEDSGSGETAGAGDEAELCDLHFIASCQSCTAWDKQDKEESDDEGWMSHSLSFAADKLGKDLSNRKKAEEELVVIDPREKARTLKEGKRAERETKVSGSRAWDQAQARDQARNAKLTKASSLAGRASSLVARRYFTAPMSASNSRKRAAPGASPVMNYPQRMQQPFAADNAVQDSMLRWKDDGAELVDAANAYGLMPSQPQYAEAPASSNSLARRDVNQALIPTHSRNFDASVEPWAGFGDANSLLPQNGEGGLIEQDNIEALEEMAQKAKREAQAKRKGIPPFVQKLSSFLEERKNEHFIRWSEKGDSFIVLDEDEFAKTLIPELFKHNNYASFVRQLNMYGFHKRVGLSDNSMRASERKNKSPSEYHNPFFRRGHPNLLWLINKPKSRATAKKSSTKNEGGEMDSDEDQIQDEVVAQNTPAGSNVAAGRSLPSAPTTSSAEPQGLPKKEMTLIREELNKVREQQKMIHKAINQLQHNNNELYNQALMFQSQHDRHQNSINAILNFLANVFRKTLEDQGNTQSVGDILSSMITNQGQPSHQGSVVDLGDFFQTQMDPLSNMGGPHKRTRGLLPPIPNQQPDASAAARPPSSTSPAPYYPAGNASPEMGHVTELVDGSDGLPSLRQQLESNPHERMMKIINDHNATNTSGMDLPEATELVANAPNTLNKDQRSKFVDFMAGQTTSPPSSQPPSASTTAKPTPTPVPARPAKASVSPSPSPVPPPSPVMRSPQMAPPSLNEISTNQIDLDQLQRLQSDQDAKIHELTEMLGPLSPSGRIPGLDDGTEAYFDPPNVDLDQYLDSNAFLDDAHFGDGNDFNFNLDGAADVVKNGQHSPTGTEEIQRDDCDTAQGEANKKQRVA